MVLFWQISMGGHAVEEEMRLLAEQMDREGKAVAEVC